jgi:signal transduction histidine kinase
MSTDQVRSDVEQLAGALLDNVERIAARSVARMQELLPSYAKVPAEKLVPVTLTNTRNLLEAVRDPDANPVRDEDHFRVSGETRLSQQIAADEMLQAWRIGLEVVREEAHPVASRLGIADDVLLAFVEATLQWGDLGMRRSALAYHETEIRELQRLAAEQAALRRVATLVAQDAAPDELFGAVAAEVGTLFAADYTGMIRYEPGHLFVTTTATWAAVGAHPPVPARSRIVPGDPTTMVAETGRPARVDDWASVPGPIAEFVRRELGVKSSVGSPIVVNGTLWGALALHSKHSPLPPDTESRLLNFTELVATAVANADSRDQLTASRARLVTEADEARRRVVRDLHDGAQQRLVQTILTLRLAQRALEPNSDQAGALIAEALAHAQQATTELRELALGILPAVLAEGGLRSGISAIVSRLDLPVDVDVPSQRFPPEIEASAYFVVAEALTNVVKHSHAERAEVKARLQDGMLRVEVRDDGVGGADLSGHGLVGLGDRVTAIGGQLVVESPESGGTLLAAKLPVCEPFPSDRAGAV